VNEQYQQPLRSTLLGAYPISELHLVGTNPPMSPRSPSQWRPTPPPLQYGVDYSFLDRSSREPTRWRYGRAITIRLPQGARPDQAAALIVVVTELRAHTGMDLLTGLGDLQSFAHQTVPDQEIHVQYLSASVFQDSQYVCGDRAGTASVDRDANGAYYRGARVTINDAFVGDDARSRRGLVILRHMLSHALGLGHAYRSSLLMHDPISASLDGYGRGDRYGLSLLGKPNPASRGMADAALWRSLPCAI
jgi:hypothetical protein